MDLAPGIETPFRVDLEALTAIEARVLWLATRMIDAANHDRTTGDGVKVGGHQASSASMVTIMTALWFAHLRADDRVSVKPHASPVFHAIEYLLGKLDRSYLTTLRAFGGLQSYPSRTKDPDHVDFSTGSVGLGAVAPIFAALCRRYVDDHFGARPASRFISLVGDAELDEGNVWEAIEEPSTQHLGNVMWIVDFNRQSLDRVVPGIRIAQWRAAFEAAGWHVVEAKYGKRLSALFERPGGSALRDWIDHMPNERYQSLFAKQGPTFRRSFLEGAPDEVHELASTFGDDELALFVRDLAGHDLASLLEAFARCDAVNDRPSVVFAYTVKGFGLPIAGNPRNHSALCSSEQIDELRGRIGLTPETEWDRFDLATPAGRLCARRADELTRPHIDTGLALSVPESVGVPTAGQPISSQDAFGRILVGLSRHREVSPYLVTTAPDVATSTNLAGYINRAGVYAPVERHSWDDEGLLRWVEGPAGHHLELGISEMNLFLLLGQLGLADDLSAQRLLPIGTVYDPFVCRGLDAFIYSAYSKARFIVVGTPSGVTLAPEGGAHQSSITSSIGLELPNVTYLEPAFATALDWLLCDALNRIANGHDDDGAFYFRLSTRPIDQSPFEDAARRLGTDALRSAVLSGAYLLRDAQGTAGADSAAVYLAGSGAVLPEMLAASELLGHEGVAADVVDLTSPDRLYRAWQQEIRRAIHESRTPELPAALRTVFSRRAPVVSVHDAASHTLAWLGSALRTTCVPLGVDQFGQSGSVSDLYRINDLSPDAIANAAIAALDG